MKARKVKGLEPDGLLAANAMRMASVRIDELWSFADSARRPEDTTALHDMRIAAKRLRYLLELMEPCLGSPAKRGARTARAFQSLLGEIHDCDELIPLMRRHAKRLRTEDAQAVRAAAEGADDVEPIVVRSAPHRARHRGLGSLHAYLVARRHVLYARFLREWAELEEDGLRERLEDDLRKAADRAAGRATATRDGARTDRGRDRAAEAARPRAARGGMDGGSA